ncbi:hypothetical protein [Haloarchaeobius sp. TZWWS8]|uniref:hypothetical protein n=1 Tax=Haloarchaeobius sp. TZWWS8 TaxID=3446121 RepID=UPI003EBC428C
MTSGARRRSRLDGNGERLGDVTAESVPPAVTRERSEERDKRGSQHDLELPVVAFEFELDALSD